MSHETNEPEAPATMMLMPAAPGTCPVCATAHRPDFPHNQQSLFYQVRFEMEHGRSATWWDAMAHCPPAVQDAWIEALGNRGIQVNKPADRTT